MLEEIRYIRRSLNDNFEATTDGYTRKMFRFAAVAEEELKELRDGITQAEKALREVQTYYGEGEEMGRPIPSQEFFGIFRTFTSSYKVNFTALSYLLVVSKLTFSSAALPIVRSRKRWSLEIVALQLEQLFHLSPPEHLPRKAT